MCSVQSIASHTEDDYIAFIIVASMKQTTKAMVGINNEANNFTNTQEYLLFYSTEKAKQSTFSSFKKSYVQTRVYFRHVAIISSILPFPKWQTTEDFRTWKALNRWHLVFGRAGFCFWNTNTNERMDTYNVAFWGILLENREAIHSCHFEVYLSCLLWHFLQLL